MYGQTGKFRDLAELGKGGMGDVFLAVAPGPVGFNKLLVVKRLRQSLASDPEFLRMFLNEARIAARLNHPNIVQTFEVGFDGSRHFIAMEYLQGQSLYRLIRRAAGAGGVPFEMQLRVLAEALAGLHYAHELTDYDGTPLEIVHRDFSPPNIFVLYDGQVKLVDFGIAKIANSGETRAGVFKGKIQYVSPEQYTGSAIDRRADVFSAGVILWEAATQRRMWKGAGDLTVMQRVAGGDIPLPSSVNPQVPKRLEDMCMKALALRKEDRYPTAAALQADIEDFLREIGSHVTVRDVGAFTAKAFADARAHVKVLIEEQLRQVREHPDPQSLIPMVTLVGGTGSGMTSPGSQSYPAFRRSLPRRTIALASLGGVALLIALLALWRSSSPSADTTQASHPAPAAPAPEPPSTAAEPAAPPAASVAASRLRLTVETVPKAARVSIDDALLPPNTQVVEIAKDNALHRVRAEAVGFRPKTEWVRFDSDDVTVKINLDPFAPSRKGRKEYVKEMTPSPAGPSEPPATPSVAPAAPAPASTVSQVREIEAAPVRQKPPAQNLDTGDPWKK